MNKRKYQGKYTSEHLAFMRDKYPSMSCRELAKAFNERFGTTKSEMQIKSCTKRYRITSGRTGRFEKGHEPWSLGKKGFMGANKTSFKAGGIPHNKRRLWSERITRDGYIEISIPECNPYTGAPTRFKLKHKWLWEMEHGAVPKGSVLIFKDGNKLNCNNDNLLLVKRTELLSLNLHKYSKAPSELKPTILALAKLESKAGIRTRPGR
ncbi:MAG: HNH endonuclease [Deltaproteobacteria bacterium]|nr:HNH endonuclease [Deltaproteobacteria bacterium]